MSITEAIKHYSEITGIHPAADLFPLVEGEELQELCTDIKERGLQQPIVVWHDGSLLDGRNRLLACYRTNQEIVLERYEGNDPVQFSLSANLHRRHLNAGQRAVVALKVRELLQPAAKERIAEAGRSAAPGRPAEKASPDLGDLLPTQPAFAPPVPPSPTPAEQRKSTAQAAKAVGVRAA